mgnify:CR=1 FL=1
MACYHLGVEREEFRLVVEWGESADTGLFVTIWRGESELCHVRRSSTPCIRYKEKLSEKDRETLDWYDNRCLDNPGIFEIDGRNHRDLILRYHGVSAERQDDVEDMQDCIDLDTPSARKEIEEFNKTAEAQALKAEILGISSSE